MSSNSVHASAAVTSLQRLKQDYLRLKKDPVPFISAEPLPSHMLEWHFVVEGPHDSPYRGGFYHGKLMFPKEYPFKPPAIYMQTPNGRFETNQRLCLSISDFHPELWNPSWCVSTILTGLLSFMLEDARTVGSIETNATQKRRYARDSLTYNLQNRLFIELFPEIVTRIKTKLEAETGSPQPDNEPLISQPSYNVRNFVWTNLCLLAGGVVIIYSLRFLTE